MSAASQQQPDGVAVFLDGNPDGIFCFDLSGPVPQGLPFEEAIRAWHGALILTYCNDSFARMYGYTASSDLIGASLAALLPPTEHNLAYLREFVRSGYRLSGAESHEIDRDGKPRYFLNYLVGETRDGALVRIWGSQRDITAERAARLKLEQSEQHAWRELAELEALYEAAPIGLALFDRELRVLRLNEMFADFGGRPGAQQIAGSVGEAFPEVAELVEPLLSRVLTSGQPALAIELSRPTGPRRAPRAYLANYFPVRDAAGDIFGVSAVILEITARKRAEESLRVSEAYYRAVFEQSPLGIAVLSRDGSIIRANRAWQAMWGIPEAAPEYSVFRDQELRRRGVTPFFDKALSGEAVQIPEFRYRSETGPFAGRDFWVRAAVYPVPAGSGDVSELVLVHQDVSEQRRAEQNLAESRERLALAVSAGGVGAWDWDMRNDDIQWTEHVYEIHGVAPGTPIGGMKEFTRFVHPDDLERVSATISGSIDEKTDYVTEFRVIRPDGEIRWVSARGRVLYDESGTPERLLGAVTDVTERKRAEEVLLVQAHELAVSNADLQQFAYVTSHDLQEPLRTITSYAQLLERRYKGRFDTDADEFLAYITAAAGRMSMLISDLLTYSRIFNTERTPLREVDLSASLNWAFQNLESVIRLSGAVITWELLPMVRGDQVQLVQLFQNLIGNAIKYRSAQTPLIHIGVRRTDGELTVSVRDNGIGIDPQYHDRIFGLFKRLHSTEIPGTGIGLAICRKIVERHGGRIWVESAPGSGATFSFTLAV